MAIRSFGVGQKPHPILAPPQAPPPTSGGRGMMTSTPMDPMSMPMMATMMAGSHGPGSAGAGMGAALMATPQQQPVPPPQFMPPTSGQPFGMEPSPGEMALSGGGQVPAFPHAAPVSTAAGGGAAGAAQQVIFRSIISQLQAKSAKDDALREVLVNRQTYRHVTHRVLQERNAEGQTLLAIIEVNRVNLAESLPIVLKKEYGCHRRDILKTEQCLSRQLESSMSSGQIIMELNDLENSNSLSKRMKIWTIIFCRSFFNDKFDM